MHEVARSSVERLADNVSASILFPLRNKLKKDGCYRYVSDIDQFNDAPRDVIVNHQRERQRQIASAASANTEFYRERIRNAGIHDVANMSFEQFATIRSIAKNDVREHQTAQRVLW